MSGRARHSGEIPAAESVSRKLRRFSFILSTLTSVRISPLSIAPSVGLAIGSTRSSSRFAKTRKASSITSSLYGKQLRQNGNFMKKMNRRKKPVAAETIARMADLGKDVSRFFTNSGHMRKPIQRVNVDFTAGMLEELEVAAKELNVSRQAVIKTLVRQGLDQRQTARSSRRRAARH
jgi:hypothetical protein